MLPYKPLQLQADGVYIVSLTGVGNIYQDHFMTGVGAELKLDQHSADIILGPEVFLTAMKMVRE